MAHRVGRSPESVSNIERGQQLPTLETLIDLGRALDVPLLDLIGEVATDPPQARERVRLEARMREITRRLSDRDLLIAVKQAKVFMSQK